MAFDILAAVMAFLSVISFGMLGGADIIEEEPQIELSGVTDTVPQKEPPASPVVSNTENTEKPGAEIISGTWSGKASVPFIVSVEFRAEVRADGTAQFSGTVTSSMFGDHVFDTPAIWEYQSGKNFDTVISGTHTAVTCDGTQLTFPLNPYKLGLVDNEIADKEFIIDLHRI